MLWLAPIRLAQSINAEITEPAETKLTDPALLRVLCELCV